MVSLAGESQNFDGNGTYARLQAGGGIAVQTPPVGAQGPFHASTTQRAARHASGEEPEAALQARREVPHPAGARPE